MAPGLGSGSQGLIQLRRSWDLPVQDAVEQGDAGFEAAPTSGHVEDQVAAGAAEDGATGEHLCAERGGLAVAAQAGGTLIYARPFGPNNRFIDLVFCVAAHPIAGVYSLLMDRARVLMNCGATLDGNSGAAIGYPGIDGYSYFGPNLGGDPFGPGSGAG